MTPRPEESADTGDVPLGRLIFNSDLLGPLEATLRAAPTLKERDELRGWAAVHEVVVGQLTRAAQEILGASATDLLTSAWRLHDQLLAAARRTAAHSGARETVQLADCTLTSTDRTDLDVVVGGLELTSVAVDVVVTLHVGQLEALVAGSLLRSVTVRDCSLRVALRVDEVVLARTAALPLRRDRPRVFDPGIALLGHG